jgi:hypothetical protein
MGKFSVLAEKLDQTVATYQNHLGIQDLQQEIRNLDTVSAQELPQALDKMSKHYDTFFSIAKKNATIANDFIKDHWGEQPTQAVVDARACCACCNPVIHLLSEVKEALAKDISPATANAPDWNRSSSTDLQVEATHVNNNINLVSDFAKLTK